MALTELVQKYPTSEYAADAKAKMTELVANLIKTDKDCAYGVASGETAGFSPVTHDAYSTIIDVRKAELEAGTN